MADTDIKRQLMAKIMSDDWSERDALPTGDLIGDIDEEVRTHAIDSMRYILGHTHNLPKKFVEETKKFHEELRKRGGDVDKKHYGYHYHVKSDTCCDNKENHKKVPLIYSICRVCKVCGKDLGDW